MVFIWYLFNIFNILGRKNINILIVYFTRFLVESTYFTYVSLSFQWNIKNTEKSKSRLYKKLGEAYRKSINLTELPVKTSKGSCLNKYRIFCKFHKSFFCVNLILEDSYLQPSLFLIQYY